MAIYRRLKKRRGRAKILASTNVLLKDTVPAKLVFVRDRRKKDWLALLSTDTGLADEDIVRIYGKRWDIEVFFKMAKQHLKLAKEIQCRDFDALIAHTTFVLCVICFCPTNAGWKQMIVALAIYSMLAATKLRISHLSKPFSEFLHSLVIAQNSSTTIAKKRQQLSLMP